MKNVRKLFFVQKVMECLLLAAVLVGCSSTNYSMQDKKIKIIHNIPQNFWVGGPAKNKKTAPSPPCRMNKGEMTGIETTTTTLNALLTVMTLRAYSLPPSWPNDKTYCH